ncbi:hypothetical protein FOC4_g10005539 [Fusarium odoratissimum]|nr:hypothetical protein FOC4_g10005539 [Fusarium odoratissimum]
MEQLFQTKSLAESSEACVFDILSLLR